MKMLTQFSGGTRAMMCCQLDAGAHAPRTTLSGLYSVPLQENGKYERSTEAFIMHNRFGESGFVFVGFS